MAGCIDISGTANPVSFSRFGRFVEDAKRNEELTVNIGLVAVVVWLSTKLGNKGFF